MLLKLDHEPGRLPLSRFMYRYLVHTISNPAVFKAFANTQKTHKRCRPVRLDHEPGSSPDSWFEDRSLSTTCQIDAAGLY